MHVKGLEIPYHEPRYKKGLGLHYTLHGTGADHCSGVMDDALIVKMKDWESLNVAELMDPTDFGLKKARMLYELGLWAALPNYLGYCIFVPWNFEEVREAVSAITGWPVTTWKLMKAAERGITMMRIFNLREGFTREDDKLPDRFYNPPSDGPIKDEKVDPDILKEAQQAYYQMMGWNRMGVPTKGCLVGLDMEWAIPLVEGIE
jgi:aldehyde:ferredoxin oxidoreductase